MFRGNTRWRYATDPSSPFTTRVICLSDIILSSSSSSVRFQTHLQLHVHTAGQAVPRHVLYGISGQTVPVSPVLHRLDKLTL